jgi:hypothetical protein
MALQKVERDFRTMKTGLLEVRPVFVRKESRTRGHVFCCLLALKLSRELERRPAGASGTTGQDPNAVTVPDALAALSRLSLLLHEIDEKTTVTGLPKPDEPQQKILASQNGPILERKIRREQRRQHSLLPGSVKALRNICARQRLVTRLLYRDQRNLLEHRPLFGVSGLALRGRPLLDGRAGRERQL